MIDCYLQIHSRLLGILMNRLNGLHWLMAGLVGSCAIMLPDSPHGAYAADTVSAPAPLDSVDYATAIQPLLAKRCYACHGPDKQEAGLRFDVRDTLIKAAESGRVPVVANHADQSEMIRRILSTEDSERMPPEGAPLRADQIAAIRQWIDQGAAVTPHWAFQPLQAQTPPTVADVAALSQPLDTFIARRLQAKQLNLSPPADAAQLIRRVYLDTTGLPPTPEELTQWQADWSEGTYQRLVDRLLADPAMGDRWARHWLDLVRFAETNSFERDGVKPNAWKYRDYVIAAINSDKPYDQFIREQIAGDELDSVTTETLTATGFYRLGLWDDEPADPLQAKFDHYDDLVSTTSQVFLALTINCARCHDHKIDPISQRDYYSLVAFMRDVTMYGDRGDQLSNNQIEVTGQELADQYKQIGNTIKQLDKRLRKMEQDAILKMPAPDQRATEGPERGKVLQAKLREYQSAEEAEEYAELKRERSQADAELKKLPPRDAVLGLAKCAPKPPPTYVLLRGSPQNEGAVVEPAFPSLLTADKPELAASSDDAKTAGRRRVLADWLASKENWLTARVMVNRIWQHYFDRGIVRSPNNFGLMGDRPTHPELIDYLAQQLMDHDWSLKWLHREILLSSTYRQSSATQGRGMEIDPDNNLFWRQSLRRLSAEQVRDSVLAVTGQLNQQQFGASFFQTLSDEVLASQSRPGAGWGNSSPADQARRSVYIHVKRSLPVPLLSAFDFPETDISCEARFLTIQPGQALGMLNSQWMQDQAGHLLARAEREAGADLQAQAYRVLQLVLSRNPEQADVSELMDLVARLKTKYQFSEQQARRAMCLAALNVNAFLYID